MEKSENRIKCPECAEQYFRPVNFEGISYLECPVCGRAAFPKDMLVKKLPAETLSLIATNEKNGMLWVVKEGAEKITDALQELEAPKEEKKPSPWPRILSVILVSAAGFWGMYWFAYKLSEDRTMSILIAACVGLPTLYLINMFLHGIVPNMDQHSNGEMQSDLEHLGTVASQIWQELRPWFYMGVVLLVLGIFVLFKFSLPRAQLYRFMGWVQKPYSNYLDVIDSKDKAALARMCDWYLKAKDTNERVFDAMELTHVRGICKSAGK